MTSRFRNIAMTVGLIVVVVVVFGVLFEPKGKPVASARQSGPGVQAEELPNAEPPTGRLRVMTWNIRFFPRDSQEREGARRFSPVTNLDDLRTVFTGLEADLWGFAEITRPDVLAEMLDELGVQTVVGTEAGPAELHAVLGWRHDRLERVHYDPRPFGLGRPIERSVGATFRSRNGGLDFSVLQVHLRAHPRAYSYRLEQYEQIVDWVQRTVARTGDDDVIVMGDLNTTGPQGGATADELRVADQILARAHLRRLDNATGCTEYWEGFGSPDGVLVPSSLDHVYVRDLQERASEIPLEAWLHCRREHCQELVSRPGEEDGTYWDLSDHCPLTFELDDRDQDPGHAG